MTFFFASLFPATAQQPAPRVYTYVERMPQLPGGGGMAAVVAAFQKRLRVPALALSQEYNRALVYFEVNTTGAVQHIRLLHSSHSRQVDQAVVQAIKKLPAFIPGYQRGRPVTVSLTLPVTICLQ